MAKHASGTVRIIPADVFHHFHQVNRSVATAIYKSVDTIYEHGRHRLEGREHSADAVYFQHPYGESPYPSHVNKWECPRRWVDGIAVEFEYL